MKKIFVIFVLFIFSFTNMYALSQKEEKVIGIFMEKIEKLAEKKGNNFRITLSLALKKALKEKRVTKDRKELIERIIDILDKNIEKEKIKLEEVKKREQTSSQSGKVEETSPQPSPLEERELGQEEAQEKYGRNYDFEAVKNYWLELTNRERKVVGLADYQYSKKLEKTAQKWSKIQKSRGKWTHKRNKNDSFYNYSKINAWFKDNGVVCKNIYRVTHSENVGSRGFTCNSSDCTESLKTAITKTFDFYMSEKGKSYAPHYKSIVNKHFNHIGFGIELDKKGKNYYQYYLTVHYCTEIVE